MDERCTRPGRPSYLAGYLCDEHASLQAALLERLAVINDFTAVALSLPALAASELRQIGAGTAVSGTGLGVSGLVPVAHGNFAPIPGEGGRVTLSAGDEREAAVLHFVRARGGRADAKPGPTHERVKRSCPAAGLAGQSMSSTYTRAHCNTAVTP